MSLVDRDPDLEADVLLRVGRVAQEPGFAGAIQQRLDEVEAKGGPDGGGSRTAIESFRGALEEYVDAPAWTIVGLTQLKVLYQNCDIDPDVAREASILVEEAMAHAAHGAHLMRGVVDLLEGA